MITDHELLDIAREHSVNIARLNAAAQVFHQLIRIQHVVADLAAERVFHAFAAQLVNLLLALALLDFVELGAQHAEGGFLVLQLRFLVLAGHNDSCGNMGQTHGGVGRVHALPAGAA